MLSIKKNSVFRSVYSRGVSVSNRLFVLYKLENNCGENCLGVTVSKKVGGAVVRNRVKRLVKEYFRLAEGGLARGYQLVVVARADAGKKAFAEDAFKTFGGALNGLLDKQGLLK